MNDYIDSLRQDIEFDATLRGHDFHFHSTWGLFSPRAVDEGTRLLTRHLEAPPDGTCLDLGCGWGPVGLVLSRLAPRGHVHMVDRDFVAVEYAGRNAADNGCVNCSAYLSNGFSHVDPAARFDVVASNLPAKVGNELFTIMFDVIVKANTPLNTWIWNTAEVTYIGGLQIDKPSNTVTARVVPEPVTIAFFGIGLFGVFALVRRRRRMRR